MKNAKIKMSWYGDDELKQGAAAGVGADGNAGFYILPLARSHLFINCCPSVSSLWGSVSTAIGCSTTSRFLMRMQFQVGRNLKGSHHRTVARIPAKKSTASDRRLISRRPHRRTNT